MIDKQSIISEKDVKIYNGVRICGSFLESGVIVGDDSRITDSTLKQKVEIARRNNIKYSSIDVCSYTGENTVILNATVGKYCSISWNVTIGGANHNLTHLAITDANRIFMEDSTINARLFSQDLKIGNDVWIAAGVNVLRGCIIGDGAVCGAGAVVTKDVPPYAIVAGVPAKIIGYRFPQEVIQRLCDLKWWDFPFELLCKCKSYFMKECTMDMIDDLENAKNNYIKNGE